MINYTPKPDTGKAIFDVQITFKDRSIKFVGEGGRERNRKCLQPARRKWFQFS